MLPTDEQARRVTSLRHVGRFTLTDTWQDISGRVTDTQGAGVNDYVVVTATAPAPVATACAVATLPRMRQPV